MSVLPFPGAGAVGGAIGGLGRMMGSDSLDALMESI